MLLHRSMSTANDAAYSPEIAETSPIIATIEAAAKFAAFGGVGGDSGGRIDEARRRLCRRRARCKRAPLLALRGCSEGQGKLRAGLLAPPDRTGSSRAAGWAEADNRDATSDGALGASEPTFIRRRTCSSVTVKCCVWCFSTIYLIKLSP